MILYLDSAQNVKAIMNIAVSIYTHISI